MILVSLVDELKENLSKLLKDNLYETKKGNTKTPYVRTGWYTVKNKNTDEEYPYVLISPIEQSDTKDDSTVELLIICATHSMDEEGWKDAALIAEKIRQFLKTNYSINETYAIGEELKIKFPDQQPYPQWFSWIHATFNVYSPEITEVYYD